MHKNTLLIFLSLAPKRILLAIKNCVVCVGLGACVSNSYASINEVSFDGKPEIDAATFIRGVTGTWSGVVKSVHMYNVDVSLELTTEYAEIEIVDNNKKCRGILEFKNATHGVAKFKQEIVEGDIGENNDEFWSAYDVNICRDSLVQIIHKVPGKIVVSWHRLKRKTVLEGNNLAWGFLDTTNKPVKTPHYQDIHQWLNNSPSPSNVGYSTDNIHEKNNCERKILDQPGLGVLDFIRNGFYFLHGRLPVIQDKTVDIYKQTDLSRLQELGEIICRILIANKGVKNYSGFDYIAIDTNKAKKYQGANVSHYFNNMHGFEFGDLYIKDKRSTAAFAFVIAHELAHVLTETAKRKDKIYSSIDVDKYNLRLTEYMLSVIKDYEEAELVADYEAVHVLHRAGLDPSYYATKFILFTKVKDKDESYDEKINKFRNMGLLSANPHPPLETRRLWINSALRKLGLEQVPPLFKIEERQEMQINSRNNYVATQQQPPTSSTPHGLNGNRPLFGVEEDDVQVAQPIATSDQGLSGKWSVDCPACGYKSTWTFNSGEGNSVKSAEGVSGKWTIESGYVVINWNNGKWDKFIWPIANGKATGIQWQGNKVYMNRITSQ